MEFIEFGFIHAIESGILFLLISSADTDKPGRIFAMTSLCGEI